LIVEQQWLVEKKSSAECPNCSLVLSENGRDLLDQDAYVMISRRSTAHVVLNRSGVIVISAEFA
jgi:hypothetical protein